MKLSQRFSSFSIEHHKKLIEEFKKHPGCVDDVWLSTLYGYPSPADHKKVADNLMVIAEMYREAGISVSLQISNTLGHGQYMCGIDCSGLVFDGSPVKNMTDGYGVTSEYCFCPRGEYFKDYILKTLEYYTPIKPDILWVDDDFRLPNHAPVDYGCFCDDCIAEFNARYGYSYSRAELTEEILHGDLTVRERFLRFQREGMSELMRGIMEVFHKGSPDTVPGLQHAVPGGYIMGSHDFAFDVMREVTGKDPVSRPGGGFYIDFNPDDVTIKGLEVELQNAALPEYVKKNSPEIENLPHCVFGKSPAGTAMETSYYFMCGASDMSYSSMQGVEPVEWYGNMLELFSKQRHYWDKLSEYNSFTRATGIRYFYSKNDWCRRLSESDGFHQLHAYKHIHTRDFLRDGISFTFDRREESVHFLHPAEVTGLTDADVRYLLPQNVITDGETLAILAEMGYNLGVESVRIPTADALPLYDKYSEHRLNGGEESYKSSFFARGKSECYRMSIKNADAEVLGVYATNVKKAPFTEDAECPYGIAELLLTTEKGGKWVVMGYQPWKGNIPMVRRERLLNIADELGKTPLAARMVSMHQAVVHPRIDGDGRTACVSLLNCTVGKCEGGELLVRNPRSENFVYTSGTVKALALDWTKTDSGYLVKLPAIDAWTGGTVFC